jgi:hypothetical protein
MGVFRPGCWGSLLIYSTKKLLISTFRKFMATPFQWTRNSIACSLIDQQGMILAACRVRNHTRPTNHQQCLGQPTTSRGEPTERSSSSIVVRNRWIGQRETVPPAALITAVPSSCLIFGHGALAHLYKRLELFHSLSSVVGSPNLVKRGEGSSIP